LRALVLLCVFVGGPTHPPLSAIARTSALADQPIARSDEMTHVTLGRNGALTLPAMDFMGMSSGIDASRSWIPGSPR
jgi:hypothetical protein